MTRKIKNKIIIGFRKGFVLFVIILLSGLLTYVKYSQAASLTNLSDTLSRLEASTASNHDIRFKTPTGMSSGTLKLYFNTAGFTSGSVDYTDIDLQYGSSQSEVNGNCSSGCAKATLAATAGSGSWGASFSSNDLIFNYPTSGGTAIASNDYIRVLIGTNAAYGATGDQQITNPSAGTKIISIGVGTGDVDTGSVAVVIIGNDQVVVSMTVDPYLTFSISQNAVALTKSGGGNTDYQNTGFNNGTANTLSAMSNGTSGYTISYNGATLTSGSNTIDAMTTKGASSTGTEQFGLNLKSNTTPSTGANPVGGSGAPGSDYNTADQFRFVPNAATTLASSSTATSQTTYTVSYIANVSQVTESGAYNTTITYIATGNF